jgi:hypothetical protein
LAISSRGYFVGDDSPAHEARRYQAQSFRVRVLDSDRAGVRRTTMAEPRCVSHVDPGPTHCRVLVLPTAQPHRIR